MANRRTLAVVEAVLLAQEDYPCLPDTRPPRDWVLSAGGVPVPREGAPFDREVLAIRASMTEVERADPANASGNVARWMTHFKERRA